MKLLFVTYGWNESGGGTTFPKSVVLELAARGDDMAVFYASLRNDPTLPPYSIEKIEENGVKLFGVYNRPALFTDPDNPEREIRDVNILEKFRCTLDEFKPDLVHFHNFHGLTFAIAEELHQLGIPSCYTPHNYHMIDPELYLLKNGLVLWNRIDPLEESEAVARNPHLKEWYAKRADTTRQLLNKWADLTLAVSRRQKEILTSYGALPDRIAIVHQASPVSDMLWSNRQIASARQKSRQRHLRVGYIGGVLPIKGVQMLVDAIQSFDSKEVQLHIYGFATPEYLQLLMDADIKKLVTFYGPYQPTDLARIACEIDVAVLPTLVEDCAPLTLLELHAMRLPVIASRIGGIPDFIADGVDGLLYDSYNINELVRLIRRCLDEPGLLNELSNNLVAPSHTFSRYIDQLEHIYATLISGQALDPNELSLLVKPRRRIQKHRLPVVSWQGDLFVSHSLAQVNRELCLQLIGKGYQLSLEARDQADSDTVADPRFSRLEAIRNLPVDAVKLTIRHQWPPDFTPPTVGHFIMIQPWEFGSLPKSWIEPMNTVVDEVWVPSSYVKECYVESGVEAERVQVVPNGVDTGQFKPEILPYQLATRKTFRFLFVGGTIHRKGIDLLLGAYRTAFSGADDVCLVIKDMGGNTFYQGQTAQEMIERFRSDPQAPEIEYIDKELSADELAGLYTACHCLVHPYRGEGFGLPIAEAMACGLAPIVTGYGAALDFCPPGIAWLLPATVEKLPIKQVGQLETVDYPWLAEPNFDALVGMLRYAAQHPAEVKERGQKAAQHIRERFTWEHAARVADERLRVVAQRPIRRFVNNVSDQHGGKGVTEEKINALAPVCEQADRLAQSGKVDQAVQLLLNQGIRVDAADPRPYLTLAEILIRAGRYQDALEVLPEMPSSTDPQLRSEIEALCHAALKKLIVAECMRRFRRPMLRGVARAS